MNPANPQSDKSHDQFESFLRTLDKVTICPYCGDPVDSDQPYCCGECHSEEAYDNGEELLSAEDGSLDRAFGEWLRAKDAAQFSGAKYEK